jgi:hypothetical protein
MPASCMGGQRRTYGDGERGQDLKTRGANAPVRVLTAPPQKTTYTSASPPVPLTKCQNAATGPKNGAAREKIESQNPRGRCGRKRTERVKEGTGRGGGGRRGG